MAALFHVFGTASTQVIALPLSTYFFQWWGWTLFRTSHEAYNTQGSPSHLYGFCTLDSHLWFVQEVASRPLMTLSGSYAKILHSCLQGRTIAISLSQTSSYRAACRSIIQRTVALAVSLKAPLASCPAIRIRMPFCRVRLALTFFSVIDWLRIARPSKSRIAFGSVAENKPFFELCCSNSKMHCRKLLQLNIPIEMVFTSSNLKRSSPTHL